MMSKLSFSSGGTVGVIVTTCNDIDLLPVWRKSFLDAMPPHYPYGLIAVDAGSYDGSLEEMNICEVFGPHDGSGEAYEHLSVALNVGISRYLGTPTKMLKERYGGTIPNMIDPFEYICWVHPDMKFLTHGWLPKLVEYLKNNPDVGKVAPELDHIRWHEDHDGNQCPWVMPTKVLREIELDEVRMHHGQPRGVWFDEKFTGIGGLEDWDLNKRVLNAGYKVRIVHDVIVDHEGMGTRSKKNTDADAIHNRAYYTQKWGTSECPV